MGGTSLEEDGRPGREFNGQQEMNKRIPKCHWERKQELRFVTLLPCAQHPGVGKEEAQ